jgi:hypothetical protein
MNSPELARQWTEFLAARKEFPRSEQLLEHFNVGTITRICDCGCNSYDLKVPRDCGLNALMPASQRGGCALSLAFYFRNRLGSLEIDIFVDAHGYLNGVDISCNANSGPVPVEPQLIEPPFHVYGALTQVPEPLRKPESGPS